MCPFRFAAETGRVVAGRKQILLNRSNRRPKPCPIVEERNVFDDRDCWRGRLTHDRSAAAPLGPTFGSAMNKRQLRKLGIPDHALDVAVRSLHAASRHGMKGGRVRAALQVVIENPQASVSDELWGPLATALIEGPSEEKTGEPAPYRVWGEELIDRQSRDQMEQACSLPNAVAGALMPDAHVGYGLPIGGVLALEGAVCPYAVGVDIACRMKLSVLDLPPSSLEDEGMQSMLRKSLEQGTVFGAGKEWSRPQQHPVMDQDWSISRITRQNKDKAWRQLGTSGSGNHFVEFGLLTLEEDDLGLPAGTYVALLSHSGSRGVGHSVCSTYSAIARKQLPKKYEQVGRLAWLDLDTEAGQEYWAAMNLMGEYAAANHAVIHENVMRLCGTDVIAGVENHHNFAWLEQHGGRELIVHRKGATPAGAGELGVIPGSMATPAYVVRGLGNPDSLHSAAHGAGRVMSRRQARDSFRFSQVQRNLANEGVQVISAGSDEVPMVYKDIDEVMQAQSDLVAVVARFDPRIVKMCDDGSRPED